MKKVRDFWNNYFAYCDKHYPELNMIEPGENVPNNSWTFTFKPDGFDHKKIKFYHWGENGHVDMQIPNYGNRLQELDVLLKPYLFDNMSIEQASKSAAVRIKVEVLSMVEPFNDQLEPVVKGLESMKWLVLWAQKFEIDRLIE